MTAQELVTRYQFKFLKVEGCNCNPTGKISTYRHNTQTSTFLKLYTKKKVFHLIQNRRTATKGRFAVLEQTLRKANLR